MPTKLSSRSLSSDAVTVANIPDGEISAAKLTSTAIADHVGQALTTTSDVSFASVTAPVTGTVSDISNHSTTDLSEGSNLYWTTARGESMFDTRLATKSTSDLDEGTNLYYTDARVQTQITAVTPPGGFVGNTQLTNALNTKVDVTTFDANIDQAVKTTSNVIFADISASGNITLDGNLTVNGTTTTVNAQTLSVADNMVYLNEGSSQTNPDLGWAGNYNDGTYAHAGIFRDATDGTFKVFHGYTPEPGAAIDVTHASFTLAPIASGNLFVTGDISVSGTVDGRDVAADGTKLDGIEAGATGDQTASEILTLIKTVDGSGSGLDADLWDGNQFDSYLNQAVLTTSSPSFESGTTVKGGFRVTETGTAQHILVGNQDSGGVNKPAMLRGVNGSLHLGYGDSWVGEGGSMTQVMTITGSSGTSRVGINNSSPAHELHVVGSEYAAMFETNSSADGTAIRLAIKSPASQGQVELDWFNDSSRAGGGYSMIQVGKTSYASDLGLMASRVGIGTSSPSYKLHVNGDTKTTSVYTDAGATYGYRLHSNSGIVASNNYMSLFTSQTNGWGFLSNGTGADANPVVRITSAGQILAGQSSSWDSSVGHQFRAPSGTNWAFNVNETSSGGGALALITSGKNNSNDTLLLCEYNHAALGGSSTTPALIVKNGGNVGINTYSPGYKLDVRGTARLGGAESENYVVKFGTDSNAIYVGATHINTLNVAYDYAGDYNLHINYNGYQSGTSYTRNLVINDGKRGEIARFNGSDHVVTFYGSIVEQSTRIVKKNILPITNALETINKLQGVTYDRIDETATNEAGLIAEDVAEVLSNLVVFDDDGQPAGVKYTKTVAYLIEAVKELTDRVKALENK